MIRPTVWGVTAAVLLMVIGCKGPQRPPTPTSQDQDRRGFAWEHAHFRLQSLEAQRDPQPDVQREIFATQLRIADLEWRMDTLPYVDYHTRRRDVLKRWRDQEEAWVKTGASDALQVDRLNVRLLRERELLHEVLPDTYRAQRDATRSRLAESVRPVDREAALRAFDAELAD